MDGSGTELLVDHDGERWRARPGDAITFGRSKACSVALDRYHADPTLHRLAGAFVFHEGGWIVQNTGTHWPLTLHTGDRALTVPEHRDQALAPPAAALARRGGVVLTTARHTYHLEFDTVGVAHEAGVVINREEATVDAAGAVALSPAQRRLVLALVEPQLREPSSSAWRVPTIDEVCARIAISRKAYERCLDAVCTKLAHAGVAGVHGDARRRAQYRRQVVVEWALDSAQLRASDLAELEVAS